MTKFLGLIVDCHLSWDSYINLLTSKLNSGLYALRRILRVCPVAALRSLYFLLIHSNMTFGLALYGATSVQNLNSILKIQKQAVRIIFMLGLNESTKNLFPIIGIMTVYGMYIYETMLSVKRQLADIQFLGKKHNYETRNNVRAW